MKTILKLLPVLVILGIGVAGFMILGSLKAGPQTTTPTANIPKVNVQSIDTDVGAINIHVNGNVMPRREISIAAEVAGRIVQKSQEIRAGRFIEAGTELCLVDRQPYDLELQRLDNELAELTIDLQQLDLEESNTDELINLAQDDLDRANRDVQRLEQARTRSGPNIITDAQLDDAQGEVTRMQNALQTLKNSKSLMPTKKQKLEAQKSLLETRKRIAQLDLDRTTISAPISGVIASEEIEEGDFVQRGTELMVLEDVSQMEVSCNLLTEDLYWIWASSPNQGRSDRQPGARTYYEVPPIPATIALTVAQQRFEWSGELARLEGSALHEKTRTVPCRVRVGEPKLTNAGVSPPSLARGMFVSVTLHVPPSSQLVRIPEQALRMNDRIYTTTQVADPDDAGKTIDQLHIHNVRIARTIPGAVIVQQSSITPSIPAGARLVVSPLQYATDGMTVKIEVKPGELATTDQVDPMRSSNF